MKNTHLRRSPCLPAGPSSLRRTCHERFFFIFWGLGTLGALHLDLFDQLSVVKEMFAPLGEPTFAPDHP